MKMRSLVLFACLSVMALVACTDGSTSNSSNVSDMPDFLPPFVVSTTPANAAVVASNTAAITAIFSEAVDPATVNASTFMVSGINGTVTYSGTTATFTPSTPLAAGTSYTVTITTGVKDFASNAINSNYTWSFTTALPDLTPPTIASVNPGDAASAVLVNSAITAIFSEAMNPGSITTASFTLMNGATPVFGTITYSGTTATFTPLSPLTVNVLYTATITTAAKDLAGNPLVSNYSWNFSTDALFMSGSVTPTGSWPEAVAIGDVNGDGRNDVVMTTSYYFDPVSDYKVFVYLQNSAGGLDAPIKYATSSTYTCRAATVAIGDIDNDGKNDVVIGNSGCALEVFTQNTSGGLNAGVAYASINSNKIRIADLNNDGLLDVVGIGGGASASVWLQNVGGTLNSPTSLNVTYSGWIDLDIGDVNNDGLTDIVVMSGQTSPGNLAVLTQVSGGTFNAPAYYGVGTDVAISGVAVGDVNGDSLNDVAVTHGGNRPNSKVGVFTQNASGTLDPIVNYASYDIPEPVEIADVTGDGRKDIVTIHAGWMAMGVYQQLADGSLQDEKLYATSSPNHVNSHGLAIGDINGDGKNDVVFAVYYSGLIVHYHY